MKNLVYKDDWRDSDWPNFSRQEMACQETAGLVVIPEFMDGLQRVRGRYGRPLVVLSGFRAPSHSLERTKLNGPGSHAFGCAADLLVMPRDLKEVLYLVTTEEVFTGIGINDKRNSLHVDSAHLVTEEHMQRVGRKADFPRPRVWTYPHPITKINI